MAPNPYAKYAAPADANPYAKYGTVGPGPSATDRALIYADNLARQFANGAFMGFGDEATAALSAATAMPQYAVTQRGPTAGEVYDQELRRNRIRDKDFTENNPTASIVSQVAGGVSALPLLPGMAAAKGATWLGNTVRGAMTGVGYGGAAGFGHGEGGLDNRLLSAGIGAAGGAVLGGATPTLAAAGGLAARGLRESPAGQWIGANVAAPVYDKAASVAESLVRRRQPGNLSAAAPEGGQGLPVESPMLSVAEALRRRAAANREVSTRGAQERLAAEFERYGLDPQNVGRELERLGPDAVLANAGGMATQRLARTAYDAPGGASQIIDDTLTAQRQGAPGRMQSAFEGAEPPPTAYEAQRFLEANKGRVGGEVYPPAWEAGLGWTGGMGPRTPEINRLLQNPAVREAFDQVVADAAKYGREMTPLQMAHMVKRQLNNNADAAYASGRAINKDMVGGLADEWERALWTANPKLADADAAYARAAQLPERFQQGRDFLRSGTSEAATDVSPSALADVLPQLDDAGRLVFRAGATNTARDIAATGPGPARRLAGNVNENEILQQKLVEIYGPQRAAEIMRMSAAERQMMLTDAGIRGGPNTASKLAHLADDGLSLPNLTAPTSASNLTTRLVDAGADWLRRQNAGNEPIRTEIARILMERNPTANLQNLEVVEALMRQRLNAQLRASRAGAGTAAAGGGEMGGFLYGP